MSMLPSLAGLEAFEVVARRGSFTAAATELHVTQSAISHRVRTLEDQLGVTLFFRERRGVTLTEAGVALSVSCLDAFRRLRAGVSRARETRDVLTVSCSPSFALYALVPRLPDLRRAHPELDVRVQAADALVTPGLGGVGACVRYGPGGYRGVRSLSLGTEWVEPVCAPAIAERLTVPADLVHATLLHDDVLREHAGHLGWAEWLRSAGESSVDPDGGHRFSHAHLALEGALAGQGVVLGRSTLVARAVGEGRLVRPFDAPIESGLGYHLILPTGPPRPEADAFGAWLRSAIR